MKRKNKPNQVFSAKKQALNIGFVLLILGITFFFLIQNLNETGEHFDFSMLKNSKWWFLLPGILCLALSVLCEAASLSLICRKIGYRSSLRKCTVYASADLYFSTITPSASGGQPAAAYYMTKDGIPLPKASAALVLNVTVYTVALLLSSLLALILRPQFFLDFSTSSKAFFLVSIGFHLLLVGVCLCFMFSRRLVYAAGYLVIGLFSFLHIFKDRNRQLAKFKSSVENYRACVSIVKGNPLFLLRLIILGLLQRLLLTPITYLVFLCLGVQANPADVLIMQIYCTVAASAVPLPGAMGISESLFVTMFTGVFFAGKQGLSTLAMILSRSISSYLSILLCGTITITHHIRSMRKRIPEVEVELVELYLPLPPSYMEQQVEYLQTVNL